MRIALRERALDGALFWPACLVGGALIALACLLPAIEIGQSAYVGAGESQRGYVFDRTLRLIGYVRSGSLPFLVGGPLLVLAGLLGLLRRAQRWLPVLACAASLAGGLQAVRLVDRFQWPEGGGVHGCVEEPLGAARTLSLEECAGSFLAPAIRELQRDIRKKPIAREPGFGLLGADAYRARRLTGWRLIEWVLLVLAPWTTYRALRLVVDARAVPPTVAAGALAVLVWFAARALRGLA